MNLYEGNVDYRLNDNEINNLHCISSDYYKELFENFSNLSFLNLLLIKRKAFDYEKEVRYILQGRQVDKNHQVKAIDIDLPWNLVLHKVVVEENTSDEIIDSINKALLENMRLCKCKYPNRYITPIHITKSKIYKAHKPIIIEHKKKNTYY